MYSPYYSIDKWKGNKIRKGIHVGLERGNGMRLEKEVDFVMICFSLTLVCHALIVLELYIVVILHVCARSKEITSVCTLSVCHQ